MLFIVNADPSKCVAVQKELENDYLKKINSYPTTIYDAMNLLLNHKEIVKPVFFVKINLKMVRMDSYQVRGRKSDSRHRW